MDVLIGFTSGVGVSLVGAIVALWLQRAKERKDRINGARFRVYLQLLELSNYYFYVASAECAPERRKVDPETKIKIQEKAWAMLDQLREEDRVDHMEEILFVLSSENFESASKRHDAMCALIKKLGRKVSPKFSKAAEQMARENLLSTEKPLQYREIIKKKAPTNLWP